MTVTNSISSQSFGTSTNVGDKKFPQKVTANAASTKFAICARVTNGAAGYDKANAVTVYFGCANFDVTAAVAAAALRPVGELTIRPGVNAADVAIAGTKLFDLVGGYIYFWCNVPNLAVASTLDVSCIEST